MISIPTLTVNEGFVTVFSEEDFPQHARGGMNLTERIDALNLRIRTSEVGYESDWHVAGDPTLILVQSGILRIALRNGEHKNFGTGSMFIAKDYLPEHISFDTEKHGHCAKVVGNEPLLAVHIKLEQI
ncbi:cupin domain-containing protein [Roseivirga echinicomitans]|uniref:Uncharacterized protein n=1 Tax=Roseivirga echinicomitans TaxID=296218 RepID=A0A150X9U6_9BACT|nr:hypothetical protein [Roseivirga echinicomitans]KYG75432.1 hypothetical protein AWN68_07760 [Roseivirga echinicomitans]